MNHPQFLDSDPCSKAEIAQIVLALERNAAHLLPAFRWLIVGRYLASLLFPQGICRAPDPQDLEELFAVLDRQHAGDLAKIVRALATKDLQDRAEHTLAFLETLHPSEWSHPAQVLSRPWYLEQLLEAGSQRLKASRGNDREKLLGIAKKLEKALRIERQAAGRREELKNHPRGTDH